MLGIIISALTVGLGFFASLPATTTYQLNSYGFGSGGTGGSTTSNYALEGITGEVSNQSTATATYTTNPGYIQTQQANVPKLTVSTPTSSTLKFVIDQQGNPSDALYAIQVCFPTDFTGSPPSCGGTTMYVKSDNTLGSSLTTADYQNYAAWGGASGTTVAGLSSSTTYYFRAKATQHLFSQTGGRFTESPYGPSSSGTTSSGSSPTLSFCIYTGANCASNVTTVAFGALTPTTVTNGPSDIHVELATNAAGGGYVYIYSANGGLKSVHANNYLVTSATANLDVASEGFGAKVTATGQTSGGPMQGLSPYTSGGNSVGALATTISAILDSSRAAVVGGTGTIQLKALVSNTTPAANDYAETLTLVAAAAF